MTDGPSSLFALENIRVNRAFIGTWGAAHSKFTRVSLFSFAAAEEIDTLITDNMISTETG
jgi:DeoR/GlpR family transcriptional regulator of sugar metabolism